ETLDELSTPFLEMLDDLTPYYQSRMSLLSPQQRKIIEFLVARRHAVPVKEIARRCFITHQTASSQLKQLVKLGHLRVTRIGRESFYELREPLFRLCLEVKSRREPIRLFVDFLRLWFSQEELEAQLHGSALGEVRMYLQESLEFPQTDDAQFQALLDALETAKAAGDNEAILYAAEQLARQRGDTLDWYQYGYYLGIKENYETALEIFRWVIKSETNNAIVWFNYGLGRGRLDSRDAAVDVFQQAVELNSDDVIRLSNSGLILILQGHHEAAMRTYARVIELTSDWAWVWYDYGWALRYMGYYDRSLEAFERAIVLDANCAAAWKDYGDLLCHFERYEEALNALQKASELGYQSGGLWWIQGILLAHLGCSIEANNAFEHALKLYNTRIKKVMNDWGAQIRRCFVFLDANRLHEGKDALKQLLARVAKMGAAQQQPFRAGLVRCLSDLISRPPSIFLERARRWLSVLREVAGDREEFSVALRLLDTAVRYRETSDERVLLQLPLEERQLLEPLLKKSPLNTKSRNL
ncbi:MAG: tetratricopeptide repeat protein, partial [Candidatus Poribacteria bacterium]